MGRAHLITPKYTMAAATMARHWHVGELQHFTEAIWAVFKELLHSERSVNLPVYQCSVTPWIRSGRGVMGGTKPFFVPLSCVSACAACCGGRPLAADEPMGGGERVGLEGKGGAAQPTVARGGWRGRGGGGGAVAMVTWLRKVWGLDVVWLLPPLLLRSPVFKESPPLVYTWILNKLLWEGGGNKEMKEKRGGSRLDC